MDESGAQSDVNRAALAGKRVLLVEDSADDGDKYAAWLTAAGAQVERVATMKAARAALDNRSWDLVVADRLLADGDSFEWLRAERLRGASVPPCLVISGYIDEKMYRAIYEAGAVPLPKQYILHPDVLLAAAGTALRRASRDGY
jgi:DNA-binding response OmpR family regulator